MFKINVLSRDDVAKSLSMPQVIDAVEDVYKAKSGGDTVVWHTIFYEFDPGKSDMDIKSGYLKKTGLFGHKTVSWFGENAGKGLPTLIGTITVYDAETGAPIGITDASYITGMRTGAAGAIGAKYLARGNSEGLLIVGAGNQAIFQIAATLTLFPRIKTVRVAAIDFEEAKAFTGSAPEKLRKEFKLDVGRVKFEPVGDLGGAVYNSDIIITVTPSKSPIIKKEWVRRGTHFSCIGADMTGKEELEPEIFSGARIFADDMEHCIEAGEMEIPLKKGIITKGDIVGEIGDLILGKVNGRTNENDITIFDATGIALLDIATAQIALQYAKDNKLGAEVEI